MGNRGLCNLTTLNCYNHIVAYQDKEDDIPEYLLDYEEMLESQRLSARAAFRLTDIELEMPQWDKSQKEKRLTGCSLTGYMDALGLMLENEADNHDNILSVLNRKPKLKARCNDFLKRYNQTIEDLNLEELMLIGLRIQAHLAIEEYCEELKLPNPHKEHPLITTVKPEGTLTLLSKSTSQGIHASYAPYYIRRVRISKFSPLVEIYKNRGYKIVNEINDPNDTTRVVEFPCKAQSKITKKDVTALQQLERYKTFMLYYVDHNASNTIDVHSDEWEIVEKWVYENWEDIVSLSFMPVDDNKYQLCPYEEITAEQYNDMVKSIRVTSNVGNIIMTDEDEVIIDDGADCPTGHCPIR